MSDMTTVRPKPLFSFDVDQMEKAAAARSDLDQSACPGCGQNEAEALSGVPRVWSSTRIVWDQQIFLLWILLTPVFLTCTLLVFAAPLFFRDRGVQKAHNDALAGQPRAMTDTAEQEAA